MEDFEREARLVLMAQRRAIIAEQQTKRRNEMIQERHDRLTALENQRAERQRLREESRWITQTIRTDMQMIRKENFVILIKKTFHR